MLYLSALYIYPVKSLPAVPLQEAEARVRGLAGDRRWMLVDEGGRFISLREERRLLDFRILPGEGTWRISRENARLEIPRNPESGKPVRVTIWEDSVNAWEVDPGYNTWFSRVLDRSCRLVFMPPEAGRSVKKEWRQGDEEVSFADGYPYLVVNEASVNALEADSGLAMNVLRFRPNLILGGGEPYGEFLYREFSVGDAVFTGLKPCERCVVTTLDPETGEQGKEPLNTLAGSAVNGKVVFGQHATLKVAGRIKTGDEVQLLAVKDSPYDPL